MCNVPDPSMLKFNYYSHYKPSGIEKMTETSRASASHTDQQTLHGEDAIGGGEILEEQATRSADSGPEGQSEGEASLPGDQPDPHRERLDSSVSVRII